jgi:hypothetical protein
VHHYISKPEPYPVLLGQRDISFKIFSNLLMFSDILHLANIHFRAPSVPERRDFVSFRFGLIR